jgi:hypothetical protein
MAVPLLFAITYLVMAVPLLFAITYLVMAVPLLFAITYLVSGAPVVERGLERGTRGAWKKGASAGINRHGEGDESSLHRRSSDPRWP